MILSLRKKLMLMLLLTSLGALFVDLWICASHGDTAVEYPAHVDRYATHNQQNSGRVVKVLACGHL